VESNEFLETSEFCDHEKLSAQSSDHDGSYEQGGKTSSEEELKVKQ
jgi:hypothetical protein